MCDKTKHNSESQGSGFCCFIIIFHLTSIEAINENRNDATQVSPMRQKAQVLDSLDSLSTLLPS
jgi:hypothetical protein